MSGFNEEKAASRLTRRRFLVLGAGAMGALALSACSNQTPNPTVASTSTAAAVESRPTRNPAGAVTPVVPTVSLAKRRLRIANSFNVGSLDAIQWGYWLVSYGTMQTLNAITSDEKILPWIAESMERNGDEGWTLRLNPAARFQNGKPIDAKAVQACLERYVERGTTVLSIKGSRYETLDARTLRIKTSRPDPFLPNYFASAQGFPIFDVSEIPVKPDPDTLLGKDAFSGPFRCASLSPERLSIDAFPAAWDGAPKLAGVDVLFIVDPQARLAALRSGEIDIMFYPPADAVSQVQSTPGLQYKSTSGSSRVFWYFNHRRPPFDDIAVRRACALGIDRKQIAEKVLNGLYDASDSWYPSYVPWRLSNVRTDVTEAKRLLQEAGWMPGPDGIRQKGDRRLSFDLYHYPQQPDSKPMAEAMQAQLKALGMEVKLKQTDDVNGTYRQGGYDSGLAYNGTVTAGNPVSNLERYFHSKGSDNSGGWGSAELDRIIESLGSEFDAQRRNELLVEAQRIIERDVPFTFTAGRPWSCFVNAAFASYVPSFHQHTYIVTKDTAPVG